jgi:hypothetical protein
MKKSSDKEKKYIKWKEELISLFNKKYPKKGKDIFDRFAASFIFDFYENLTPSEVFYKNRNIGEYL